ncbi:hypothetical protein BRDCF_p1799 [Bacteroidales bacterium CF]|nr:hypothetical protein BRDCF_p1799 [Bacteroidales bacterium CF]
MKKVKFILVLFLIALYTNVGAQKKTDLRILFVGGSSDFFTMGGVKVDSIEQKKSAEIRTASFGKLLKQYFKNVTLINAAEYTPTLSDSYDVTVFDGKPTPWRNKRYIYDEKGNIKDVIPPAYLPMDYSSPTLCIAEYSNELGLSLGIKNDWYCLCLDAEAHTWVKDHPIFQGPYKVTLKTTLKPTPDGAKEYARMYGEKLADSISMWSVQNKGYSTVKTYRPGMVSRPEGYCDSPDAEIISGGVSIKSIDAIAMGRHANFFHWGFSAAPYDMTEEGKIVFINAVIYISKFKEQPVARKMNDRISTRHYVDAMKYLVTREAWEANNKANREFNKNVFETQKRAKEKLAKNEKLDEMENVYLNFKLEPEPTFSEYVKSRVPQLYHVFGDDSEEYTRYYDRNKPYFYGGGDMDYGIDIDEDVRTLGIANNDKRMLDKAITMLENGEDTLLAERVLRRYTLCRFDQPSDWRKWYETYKDKMFFSESGGWLWLINTQDKSVPGTDYSIISKNEEIVNLPELTSMTDNKNPVMASALINKLEEDSYEVVIRMKIHQGYHTYAQVSEQEPFIPTVVNIEIPSDYKKEGELKTPVFKKSGSAGTTIFEGDGIFRQKIRGKGNGEVKCTISYQCCDNTICFPPAEKIILLKIE